MTKEEWAELDECYQKKKNCNHENSEVQQVYSQIIISSEINSPANLESTSIVVTSVCVDCGLVTFYEHSRLVS